MPQLNFVKSGRGPAVVLSHALGSDLSLWDDVVPLLEPHCTVLRYDHRGHGRSEVVPGPCTLQVLADDAAALVAEQFDGPVHFVGISLGGMVAQLLAASHPQHVRSIVVANSACCFDEAGRRMWRERIASVQAQGMAPQVAPALERWFTPAYRASEPGARRVAALAAVLAGTDPRGYVASCEAIAQLDLQGSNRRIACSALVIGGAQDRSTPLALSEQIRDSISGAQLAVLDTAHLGAVEQPEAFAALVERFLRDPSADLASRAASMAG